MNKIQEDLDIKISETPRQSFKTYTISIGDNGEGSIQTEDLSGYLEAVILPEHLSIFLVSIRSVQFPEWEIFNLRREDQSLRILPIRMQCFDEGGHPIQNMDKIPLIGRYNIIVTSAVPNSQLNISLIFGQS